MKYSMPARLAKIATRMIVLFPIEVANVVEPRALEEKFNQFLAKISDDFLRVMLFASFLVWDVRRF